MFEQLQIPRTSSFCVQCHAQIDMKKVECEIFNVMHKKADIANKGNCCFNHIIGLPQKDDKELPIFDYEMR